MITSLALTVLLLTSGVNSLLPTICFDQLLEQPSCEWYSECLQQQFKCGEEGYPISLGFKYCDKAQKWQTFPEVKEWNRRSTRCLMQQLIPYLNSNLSCAQLKEKAFDTHAFCYAQGGFCDLFFELGIKKSVIFMKELISLYEFKDVSLFQLIKHSLQLSSKCFGGMLGKKGQPDQQT